MLISLKSEKRISVRLKDLLLFWFQMWRSTRAVPVYRARSPSLIPHFSPAFSVPDQNAPVQDASDSKCVRFPVCNIESNVTLLLPE